MKEMKPEVHAVATICDTKKTCYGVIQSMTAVQLKALYRNRQWLQNLTE